MFEVLTADEKLALQQPHAAAQSAAPPVRRAQFPTVGQLEPTQITALRDAMEGGVRLLAKDLSRLLRAPCSAEPSQAYLCSRSELPPMDEVVFWAEVDGRAEHAFLFSFPRDFAAALCERVLGARLELRDARPLTTSESGLCGQFVRTWLPFLREAWNGHTVKLTQSPGDGAGEEAAAAGSWVVIATTLLCGSVMGSVSVAMSPSTVCLLLGQEQVSGAAGGAETQTLRRLSAVPLELRAVLGQAEFSLDELGSLRVGDVIALDRRPQDPIEIFVGDSACFQARAGLSGKLVALELIGTPAEVNYP